MYRLMWWSIGFEGAAPPVGQSPRASRYRYAYSVNEVIRACITFMFG